MKQEICEELKRELLKIDDYHKHNTFDEDSAYRDGINKCLQIINAYAQAHDSSSNNTQVENSSQNEKPKHNPCGFCNKVHYEDEYCIEILKENPLNHFKDCLFTLVEKPQQEEQAKGLMPSGLESKPYKLQMSPSSVAQQPNESIRDECEQEKLNYQDYCRIIQSLQSTQDELMKGYTMACLSWRAKEFQEIEKVKIKLRELIKNGK